MQWNDETLEELSMSVRYTKCPSALAYDEMNNDMKNEQWSDETIERLSKSVKHTKLPSALAYDEMNIYVKRGE